MTFPNRRVFSVLDFLFNSTQCTIKILSVVRNGIGKLFSNPDL